MLFNFFLAYSLWDGLPLPAARYNAQLIMNNYNFLVNIYPSLHESWVGSNHGGGVIFPTNMSIDVGPDGPVVKNCPFEGILFGCLNELLFWDECVPGEFEYELRLLIKERIEQALPRASFCVGCGSVTSQCDEVLVGAMLNLGGVVKATRTCGYCHWSYPRLSK